MYSSSESIFVTLPIATLALCVLWLPFWLIGIVRWARKHDKQQPVSRLLRASVLWPLVPLLFSVIGGTLYVVHGNGPTRQADELASDFLQHHQVDVEQRRTWSNRHDGCGKSDASFREGATPITVDEATASLEALGWRVVNVRPPDEYRSTPIISGERGFATIHLNLTERSRGSFRVNSCRDGQLVSYGSEQPRAWAIGLDLPFWATVAAWIFGLWASRWFWHWQKLRSPLMRIVCLFPIIATLTVLALMAVGTWTG